MQIPVDGSAQTKLYSATSGEFGAMSTSPDGSLLAFVEGTGVNILSLGTSPAVRTLLSGAADQIAWSPNGASIAIRTATSDFQTQVTAINVDGTGQRNMAETRLLRRVGRWNRPVTVRRRGSPLLPFT